MTPSNEAGPPDGASGRKPKSAGEKRRRRWYEARKKGRLLGAQLGVEVRCVDCAQTQGAELERELEGARCIWVTGGNTFFLLQHMRSSGAHSQWMPSPRLPRPRPSSGVVNIAIASACLCLGHTQGSTGRSEAE